MSDAQPNEPCPCGSDKPFARCCEPFLTFQERPRTLTQLIRARYNAYRLGRREFLIKTWHPATARSISIADLVLDYEWLGLEILATQQKGDYGQAEFKVRYRERDGETAEEGLHHEKSVFHRLNGTWLYLEGVLLGEDEEGNRERRDGEHGGDEPRLP